MFSVHVFRTKNKQLQTMSVYGKMVALHVSSLSFSVLRFLSTVW